MIRERAASSHRRSRDGFVDAAPSAAGLPILHVRAAASYHVDQLKQAIAAAIRPAQPPAAATDRQSFKIEESNMLISERMKSELQSEAAMTRKLLAKIPNDKFGYKPADGLHTIGWNAGHLAEIPGWAPSIVTESEFDMPEGDVTPESTDTGPLLRTFDDNLAKALAALEGVPDSVFDEPWSLKIGGQVVLTMSKGDCLRKWVLSHTAHHRGILSVYLRMAGVKHGSIYEE